MRHALIVTVLVLAGCGPMVGTPDDAGTDDGRPCTSQLECTTASELKETCEAGQCSGPLPQKQAVTLYISRYSGSAIGEVGHYRAIVFSEVRPDGSAVTCAELLSESLEEMGNPLRYNVLSSPGTTKCSQDCGYPTLITLTFLDRPGRLIFAELYHKDFPDTVLGRGCLENATPLKYPPSDPPREGTYVTVETH